jgi:opacity protein-like surface antigen
MRRWLLVLCLLAPASHAGAGEFDTPTLRGSSPFVPAPPSYFRWAGVYGGVHASHNSSGMNFSEATQDLIAFILRETAIESEHRVSEWPLLGKANVSNVGYGAFFGYNSQWDNVIVGLDVTYTRSQLSGSSADSIGRMITTTNEYNNSVDISGFASLDIKDWATVRARAGASFGRFLPYLTVGGAIGRADYMKGVIVTTSGTYVGTNDPPLPPYGPNTSIRNADRKNMVIYGYAVGAGMDIAVLPNVFLRAEGEFVQFSAPANIDAYVGSFRGAVGLKF